MSFCYFVNYLKDHWFVVIVIATIKIGNPSFIVKITIPTILKLFFVLKIVLVVF